MAQISKKSLDRDIEEAVSDLFLKSLSEVDDRTEIAFLLQDLLTSTEKSIISKRLAVAFMLRRGFDHRTIANVLKVSTPTVWRMNEKLKQKGSGMRILFNRLEADPKWGEFLGRLEATIDHASVSIKSKKK
jgi:uncharacterized protein YerC